MEVFAEGFQPREVQFAIVEQNPTLLNITLFREETNYQRLVGNWVQFLEPLIDSGGSGSEFFGFGFDFAN